MNSRMGWSRCGRRCRSKPPRLAPFSYQAVNAEWLLATVGKAVQAKCAVVREVRRWTLKQHGAC